MPMKSQFELSVIEKVKLKRESHNVSQKQLAYLMDLSVGFIGRVESPKFPAKWNLDHINKLAEIFDCSPKDFLPDKFIKERKRNKGISK
jgi:transcriptional regulator with XRE-family HTH domain